MQYHEYFKTYRSIHHKFWTNKFVTDTKYHISIAVIIDFYIHNFFIIQMKDNELDRRDR